MLSYPPANEVAERWYFHRCVCISQYDHYPWCNIPHCTRPSLGHQTWDPLLVTSGGDPWRPVQTCSIGDTPPCDIWWWPQKLKHSFQAGGNVSHWNAFLLILYLVIMKTTQLFLPPPKEVWGKVMFLRVCYSVHRGGRGVGLYKYPPPPPRQEPPWRTPQPATTNGGHCIGRYASYWNAFL